MKHILILAGGVFSAAAFAAGTPAVSGVSLSWDAGAGLATVEYTLSGAPGVVTFDVQTNASGDVWASVGGKALAGAWGDVNSYVEGVDEVHRIYWKPEASRPGLEIPEAAFRAVVTAWPEEAPPDYMVVDLNSSTNPASSLLAGHWFYPDADQIPGGVASRIYKTDKLVMRKIPVSPSLKWVMGQSDLANATEHYATLTNNFYMGVYEITFAQWLNLCGSLPSSPVNLAFYTNVADAAVLPVNGIDFYEARGSSAGLKWDGSADPGVRRKVDNSYSAVATPIAQLRLRTGALFDLPTEAQWEYACRAGSSAAYSDGSAATAANCGRLAWHNGNSTVKTLVGTSAIAPHPVGSKGVPNAWGLYDMHGNVREMCLDCWEASYGTADVTEPAGGALNKYRVVRGGSYYDAYSSCQSAYRTYTNVSAHYNYTGMRVVCPYPLNLEW